jgi:hypothetical protein
MAHFAELDANNTVLRVIVVSNADTQDVNGVEDETLGIAFCQRLFGLDTKWRQTSYNGNFRVRYAGIGYSYNEALDAFVGPKPYPSWSLNEATTEWDPPTPRPELTPEERAEGKYYTWNETNQIWELQSLPT